MKIWSKVALLLLSVCLATPVIAGQFTVEQDADGVTVKVDGDLFTRYHVKSGPKPVLYPVIGPSGKAMTRRYPIEPATADERDDHVHHRSFWFTHGDVNGIDFWSESRNHGSIVHREFVKAAGGDQATIKTLNDWVGPDGGKICEDERTLVFDSDGHGRWVDFTVVVRATEGPVKFGDTKEGSFGVRVAGSMKVTANKGGTIVNSEGQTDVEAWGKRASWVDYSGPVDGETVGVAILNHPSSFRYPTYWHVRNYGLFTANPFGLHHFKNSDEDGSHSMNKGESFTLRHKVIFHAGDVEAAKIASAFENYTK
jgi:hypothetical protein